MSIIPAPTVSPLEHAAAIIGGTVQDTGGHTLAAILPLDAHTEILVTPADTADHGWTVCYCDGHGDDHDHCEQDTYLHAADLADVGILTAAIIAAHTTGASLADYTTACAA